MRGATAAFGAAAFASAWVSAISSGCTLASGDALGDTKFWFESDSCNNPQGDSKMASYYASTKTCENFGTCLDYTAGLPGVTTPDQTEATCLPAGPTPGKMFTPYNVTVQAPCSAADAAAENCACNHADIEPTQRASRFEPDTKGRSCWALE